MKKLKEIFKYAQVGDKVWHSTLGWGEITNTQSSCGRPIIVEFDTKVSRRSFDTMGIENCAHKYPSLFKNEQVLDIEYDQLEIDWNKVPVDTLVTVWSDEEFSDALSTRRFIVFVNGKYTCTAYGESFKTMTNCRQWKYCKLHEGIEPLEEWYK